MESSHSGSVRALYTVPTNIRDTLGQPIGILVRDRAELVNAIKKGAFVVAVGDIVTLDLLESGITPDISIVDYMTKRMSKEDLRERFSRYEQAEVRVKNPPGTITSALWDAVEYGYKYPGKLRIIVEGEEDLAALVAIALAGDNTTVIYGIPNRGASVHHVDDELKRLVNETLEKMKA